MNTDGEGINGNNIFMYQDFATNSGDLLQLSFLWMYWYYNTNVNLSVSLTDLATNAILFDGLYNASQGAGFLKPNFVTTDFTGTGNMVRLLIQETTPTGINDNAFFVDNFSVVVTRTAIPEPFSVILLGLGALGGISLATRRARRTSGV